MGPSKRTLSNLEGVRPDLIKVLMRAYEITPVDFGVVAPAVRTKQFQQDLYAKGRTTKGEPPYTQKRPLGSPVTWTLDSKHIVQDDGYGHAVDVTAFVKGKISWDEKLYYPITDAIKKAAAELGVKIVCGIDWKKKDYGHVEVA